MELTAIQQGLLLYIDSAPEGVTIGFTEKPSNYEEYAQLIVEEYMIEEPFTCDSDPRITWKVEALVKGKYTIANCNVVSLVWDLCEDDWVIEFTSELIGKMSKRELASFLTHRHNFVRKWAMERFKELRDNELPQQLEMDF